MHQHSVKTTPSAPRFIRGLSEIASDYDLLLCDVWGVVHNGVAAFEEAVAALTQFRAKGGRVILITNAPRPHAKIERMLDQLGVPHAAYDGLVSSGDVTVQMIMARGDAPLAHIGPAYDESVFRAAERLSGRTVVRVPLEEASYVVCTGLLDFEHEKPADYHAQLALMRARQLDFICANPDIVVEVGETLYYCAGALAELYTAAGGKVIQAGKPYAPIYDRALAFAAEISGAGFDRRRVLAIGDGVNTDVRGGVNQAIDTLFITSGIHRQQLQGEGTTIDAAALDQLLAVNGLMAQAALAALIW